MSTDVITITDIIIICIGVAGLTGVSIYSIYKFMLKVVSENVNRNLMPFTKELHIRAMINTKINFSCICWNNYRQAKDRGVLNEALEELNRAIDIMMKACKSFSELNKKDQDNEVLICAVSNNLAYYLAERKKCGKAVKGDGQLAYKCAKYAYDKIVKYPEDREAYADTYEFVQEQFKPP